MWTLWTRNGEDKAECHSLCQEAGTILVVLGGTCEVRIGQSQTTLATGAVALIGGAYAGNAGRTTPRVVVQYAPGPQGVQVLEIRSRKQTHRAEVCTNSACNFGEAGTCGFHHEERPDGGAHSGFPVRT